MNGRKIHLEAGMLAALLSQPAALPTGAGGVHGHEIAEPEDFRLQIAATSAGPFVTVGRVRTARHTSGSEGVRRRRWFGGEDMKKGNKTEAGTFDVWFDADDTTGQEALRESHEDDVPIWIRLCPYTTTAGEKATQLQILVTEHDFSVDVDGEGDEGTFSYEGLASTKTKVTLS